MFPICRGLEQVSSSIFWRVITIYNNLDVMYPGLALVGVEIFANFFFCAMVFAPDMLESQSRF